MNKSIIDRINKEAEYIIKTKSTIRETSKIFGVSKSTVHKDLQERLKEIDLYLHEKIQNSFNEHIQIRHIKGGESTKKRYLKLKEG